MYKATFPGVGGNGIKLLGKKFKSGRREGNGRSREREGKASEREENRKGKRKNYGLRKL